MITLSTNGETPGDVERRARDLRKEVAWMQALQTLRAGQNRLTYREIGERLGCSEKSARRWAKTVAGDEGGSKPINRFRLELVAVAETHQAMLEAEAAHA